MAASSAKDKAHALKDSYVAGLIEGGATAPAPTMPTQDMGEQATVSLDVRTGKEERWNDGNPMYIRKGHMGHTKEKANWAAYPLSDGSQYGVRHREGMDLNKHQQIYMKQVGY